MSSKPSNAKYRNGTRTHKEEKESAAQYDHDWPTSSVPRNPSFFQPVPADHNKGWSHFIDMVKERNISWDVVGQTIKNGRVFEAEGDNRYRFLWTDPETGTTFSLIIRLRAKAFAYDNADHYCITVYRMEH